MWGRTESWPPRVDRIWIVSKIAVRCSSVTAGDVNIVVALSSVAGKSLLLPSQKERFQRALLSGGIVVRRDPGLCSSTLRS
jgi:hypothetical protein